MGAALPEDGGFDTLAGYLDQLAGEIPELGAVLEGHGLVFTVTQRSPRRVEKVRVTRAAAQAG